MEHTTIDYLNDEETKMLVERFGQDVYTFISRGNNLSLVVSFLVTGPINGSTIRGAVQRSRSLTLTIFC